MKNLKVGDLVFIQIDFLPFRLIAEDTETWTNHVGIVVNTDDEPIVAESTAPYSKATPLIKFVGRSKQRRVAVKRLPMEFDELQILQIRLSALKRMGVLYDTGFNLHSKRQFCSRYVHEILDEAAGVKVGKVETLRSLLASNPNAHIKFWRWWYFLSIPWDRKTITPASVFNDEKLEVVFDGHL